jgi:hypothetical protein
MRLIIGLAAACGLTFASLAFAAPGLIPAPELAVASAFVLLPELALTPGLVARGWCDADAATVVFDHGLAGFARLDALLCRIGLARDPDALPQSAVPAFASWTSQPGFEQEADWHAPEGQPPRLELRGSLAGRLAALIRAVWPGRAVPDHDAALARMLASPATGGASGHATGRWINLCAMLAAPAPDLPVAAILIEAALADADWRMRFAAAWGVGHFRIARLAQAAAQVVMPPVGFDGLSADDRHVLLALRDAAGRLAGGAPVSAAGSRRDAFIRQIAGLIDTVPDQPADRYQAMLLALLRRGRIDPAKIPRIWQQWLN